MIEIILWDRFETGFVSIGDGIRAIQIIRDTLGGGGSPKCHVIFFLFFLNSELKAFGSKKLSLRKQD